MAATMGRFAGVAVAAASLLSAHAASISNCGGADDIFQVSQLDVSPDPIGHRQSFTVTAIGKLSKDLVSGTVTTDMHAKVLIFGKPLVDDDAKTDSMFELDPPIPVGDVKLVIGPLVLPSLPGKLEWTGQMHIVDDEGVAVSCMAVNFDLPLASEVLLTQKEPLSELAPPTCAKPGDHLHDVVVSKDGDWDQVSATLDETVTQLTIEASLQLFLGGFPINIKQNVPVLYEPGIPKGPIKVRVKPAPDAQQAVAKAEDPPKVHIKGQIVVVDGNSQEITCAAFDDTDLWGGAVHEEDEVVVV